MLYTYKSVSDFKHSAVIQGKRYVVGPGDIIKSPTKLSYIFLEEVDESVKETVTSPYQSTFKTTIQNKITDLEKDKVSADVVNEISSLKQLIEQVKDSFTSSLSELESKVDKALLGINENVKDDLEFKKITSNRLLILKDAIKTLEEEIYGGDSKNV